MNKNRLIRTCQLVGGTAVFFILSDALLHSKYWALNFFLKRKNKTLSPPAAVTPISLHKQVLHSCRLNSEFFGRF